MLLNILNELQNHYDLVIYLILFLFACVAFSIYLLIASKKKHYKIRLKNLENNFKEVLNIPIDEALLKIETLSTRNISFAMLYDDLNSKHNELMSKYNIQISSNLKKLKATISAGKYDDTSKDIDNLDVLIKAYSDSMVELYNTIKDITKDEDRLIKMLENYTNIQYELKKRYQTNITQFQLVKDKISAYISNIDNLILEADENIRLGLYGEVEEIIATLASDTDYLNEYLNVIPGLINLASSVVLKNFNTLVEKYNLMIDEFPLEHLRPLSKMKKIKEELDDALTKLKSLDYEGLEVYFKSINSQVEDLIVALDDEMKCKKEYDENVEHLFAASDAIIRRNSLTRRSIELLVKDYVGNKEIEEFTIECKNHLEKVASFRQIIDNNIYGHKPFSSCLASLLDLKEAINDFQKHLDTYEKLVEELKQRRRFCIDKTSEYLKLLRLSQITIANCNLPNFEKRYKDRITNIQNLLANLYDYLKPPYKINQAYNICKNLDEETTKLYGEVTYLAKLMKYCEEIMQIALRRREEFNEVEYACDRASYFFIDGDFETCKQVILKLKDYNIPFPSFNEGEAL